MKPEPFSNPSDVENPYQPPESEGTLAIDTAITARPTMALLLTTFSGGVFVLVLYAVAVIAFGGLNDLRGASTYLIPACACWTVFPGLISGLIARQISLGRSTNRELILVAGVIVVPALIAIGYAKVNAGPVFRLQAFTMLPFVFQFWLASKIGRFCSGRE